MPSQRKDGRWCRACMNAKYREKRPAAPPRPCEWCQVMIETPLGLKQMFCSANCKMRARWLREHPKAPRACAVCDTDITDRRRDVRFCSNGCAYRQRRRDGRISQATRSRSQLLEKYGMTPDDYDQMLRAQGGVCAICGKDGTAYRCTMKHGGAECRCRRLHVDHDHSTGLVRALLCSHCNRGIGHFYDDPALMLKAAEYLIFQSRPTEAPNPLQECQQVAR